MPPSSGVNVQRSATASVRSIAPQVVAAPVVANGPAHSGRSAYSARISAGGGRWIGAHATRTQGRRRDRREQRALVDASGEADQEARMIDEEDQPDLVLGRAFDQPEALGLVELRTRDARIGAQMPRADELAQVAPTLRA